MKTGIIADLAAEDYFALNAINKSGLDLFERSPLHYWSACLDPLRETEPARRPMTLGSAAHCAILEPERFAKEYRCEPQPENFPGVLVSAEDYKARCRSLDLPVGGSKAELKKRILESDPTVKFFDDIEAEYSKYRLLSPKDLFAVGRMASVVAHSKTAKIVLGKGKSEQTLVWQDKETGLMCKARADWLTDDFSIIVDFKSSADGTKRGFSRSCDAYNYHRQAAWYSDGVFAVTGVRPSLFVFPVIESSPPFALSWFYPSEEMIMQGRREIYPLMRKFADCKIKNEWPGYPDELFEINLPPWRMTKDDENKQNEMENY